MPVCDWLKISRGNLLGSCEEKQTFNKLFKGRANRLIKMLTLEGKNTLFIATTPFSKNNDKNSFKAVFSLLALFVYIQL